MTSARFNKTIQWEIHYDVDNDRILFPEDYNTKIGEIPYGILYVEFLFYVTDHIEPYDIPESVVRMAFNGGIARLGHDIVPYGLETLYIDIPEYSSTTIDALPDTITRLTISGEFCYNSDHFPPNLKYLQLTCEDIRNYDHIKLPSSLEYLHINCLSHSDMGRWLENVNLRELEHYNAICQYYPETLKSLTTDIYNGIHCPNLIELTVHDGVYDEYPDTLQILRTHCIPEKMPPNLTELNVMSGDDDLIELAISSDSLKVLDIHDSDAAYPDDLPNLERLCYFVDPDTNMDVNLHSMSKLTTLAINISNVSLDFGFVPSSVILLELLEYDITGSDLATQSNTIPLNVKALKNDFKGIGARFDIPENIELYIGSKLHVDMINKSNIKVFCYCGYEDRDRELASLNCMVFYPTDSTDPDSTIFPLEVKHNYYYSRIPLSERDIPPNCHIVELDHVEIGLSCQIPNIYLYEIIRMPRTLAKSARK